jgi:hypothetical protein
MAKKSSPLKIFTTQQIVIPTAGMVGPAAKGAAAAAEGRLQWRQWRQWWW